mmetsp:Transcript_30275/g.55306  ORF Transcript_30275/g.55306 Transcript_30275/m.55306 type:complete len:88 (-) Transcript_30275:300-563(-)|eukprot:CAMPEP_0175055986 /NCGR_PEP_ID=MMETSP0052_2-20121109/10406_1 /TAXON_ID=51329 ORGANISM="Polytomella parva, Strain SAG 63-3" /NCGR_SAMPLE_ID=MMETSP0052_2 /ASSEMBLY_ACC=CAM_ASM_000194 /LENGTH=87 /DNA_ID=CAMNT_0016320935 /DNA_START=130 /DNA_END=393 /DNA_ORIENTATION=+
MELTQQVKNYIATSTLSKPLPVLKDEDKGEYAHYKSLQALSNEENPKFKDTLRIVSHDGSRSPKVAPKTTQKHPGYIRNESGGYFTS